MTKKQRKFDCAALGCPKRVTKEFTFCSKHSVLPVVEAEVTLSVPTLCATCKTFTVVEGVCPTCIKPSTATVVEIPLVEGNSLSDDLSVLMDKFLAHAGPAIGAGKGFFDGLLGGRTKKDTLVVDLDKDTVPTATLTAKSVRGTAWALLKKGTDKIHAFLKKHVAQISVGVTSMLVGLPLATSFMSWAAIAAVTGGSIMFIFHLIRAKGDIKRLAWADYMDDVTGTVVTSLLSMVLMTASIFWPLFLMQDLVEMGYLFNSTKA
jgi:hypothetical protein